MPRTNIKYQNTIIYKIVCNDLNMKEVYVGSTTDFVRRKTHHKSNCMNNKCTMIYTVINKNGGWKNWSMIEIEKYPCNDKREAESRERHHYELLQANLNSVCPFYDDVIISMQIHSVKLLLEKNKLEINKYCIDNCMKGGNYESGIYLINKFNIKPDLYTVLSIKDSENRINFYNLYFN